VYLGQPDTLTAQQLLLQIDLGASAAMTLEDLRQGQGFRLQIDVTALLTSPGVPGQDALPLPGARSNPSPHPQAHWQDQFEVSQADWNQVLASWNRGLAVPLAVPLPELVVGPDRALVVQRLIDAQARMNNGDFKGSLAASREAVELLRTLSAAGPLPRDPKDRNAAQRRHALIQALFDLTSAAVHPDPVVRDTHWHRQDAMLALASAAAVAQRLFLD
jgi:hypothetical protein